MQKIILLLLFACYCCFGQEQILTDYFMKPLDIPVVVSGTFGELRSNHFHSGLDLKTNGEEGLPVYAAASGRVSRIKVAHGGYGKAIYLLHPNGYTTVYAHLQKFAPEIEAYVKKRQYAKESYEIELFPKSESLKVNKGDIIAFSGNTGGSSGPHLHFEIRDSKSRPMNPLSFGIEVEDTRKPIVNSVWAYSLNENSHVNQQQEPYRLTLTQKGDGTFKAENITAYGTIGFGISTVDKQDLAQNHNGVYKVSAQVNGQEHLELEMNRFSFAETRYINRLIDYKYYKQNRSRISKLFVAPNNPLTVFKKKVNNGYVDVKDSLSYLYSVSIQDFNNNTTIIEVPILGKNTDTITKWEPFETSDLAKANENYVYTSGIVDLLIPKGSLYQDTYLDLNVNGETAELHNDHTPLHKNMTIVFDVSRYKDEDKKNLYIGRIGHKDKVYYTKTTKKENRFSTRTRTFGKYSLFTDTQKPTIVPINVSNKKWISQASHLKIKINDAQTGIKSYRGTINGKFILMEYDYKTGMLVYDFSDNVTIAAENNFKLVVFDNVGNRATFETTFYRKP
ncbi:M23 family metallopeptidase [Aquimarina sp. U1-2]|uniref:M23 family metallopeptidase n=1 Tax=Aquimarina sp. U1-2 TaxID=2823141 RepID=UPI001AECEB2A|nr:M23 family metallopeptidase [Aquimarina sp. U1-2]MBP2832793.1 M23 family metallopeptidase [Aquimarina sp. U1-2]